MKRVLLVLLCAGSIYSMEVPAVVQKYRERMRDTFFNEVPQAKTAQGFQQAFDYFYELSNQEMIPEITCVIAHAFYEEHGSMYPEIAQTIVRFHNCVIEKAFSMSQKGKEIEHALKAVASNPHDRSYILSGQRNKVINENEFAKKTAEIAEVIKGLRPYFGIIDENAQ